MVTFHCRYCQEQTGPVPFPKTDMEQFWLRAFLSLHEACGVSAVEAVKPAATIHTNGVVTQEERTPATLRHEHEWLAVLEMETPGVFVQDCHCGARQRIRKHLTGRLEVLNDGIVEGGSLANAVYVVEQGKPTTDRWHR